ncbi:MAG: thermostable hemolysin [Steroidobacteraceae bacterium]
MIDLSCNPGRAAVDDVRPCTRHTLIEAGPNDPQRSELESFVRAAFAREHGAEVRSFMPTLLGLRGRRTEVCGVAGFRLAAAERLYLESYLDAPAEHLIADRVGESVSRDQVTEVGNLAGASCSAASHLVTLLPKYLSAREQRWVVFTATSALRAVLARWHAPVFELGPARGECVSSATDAWGRYYETDPRVMVGDIHAALQLPSFARAVL